MSRLLSKKELRLQSGLSETTFRQYLNVRYYNELKTLGYNKNQKILSPAQIKFLRERLVIIDD